MADWMASLARRYAEARTLHPDDRLLIVFDIDGTILDPRHMVCHVLLEYDRTRGTSYFRGLTVDDVDVHEDEVERLVARFPMPRGERGRVLRFYDGQRWRSDAVLASHRPYRGVMEVIRWFQLQPGTDVALNTGRPESLRADTLRSLNELGRACRVSFRPELLQMNADGNAGRVAEAKAEGLRELRRRGYRVVAVIDNEPLNIETMARADEEAGILFLHADTLFRSRAGKMPRTVSGRDYDLTRLFDSSGIPDRVQFVWHGVESEAALEAFLASSMQWCEANIRTDPYGALVLRAESYDDRPWRRDEMPTRFERFVGRVADHGRSMKLDLDGSALERVLGTLCMHGLASERLWFNASVEDLGEQGIRLIRTVFPGAAIQCPVDFLAPALRALPAHAEAMLETLSGWGIDRFSVSWATQKKHDLIARLEELGYAVNIYDVPDLRAFLEAALMLPRSITARFGDVAAGCPEGQPDSWPLPAVTRPRVVAGSA